MRILFSYGIPKSASTFAWYLIKTIAISGGISVATLSPRSKGTNSIEDYVDPLSDENLRLVIAEAGDKSVVLKTHGWPTRGVVDLIKSGNGLAFASYRDFRDVALSLMDHAARSRKCGNKDFAEFYKLSDTISLLQDQERRFSEWRRLCDPLLIPYDEICFDTRTTIKRIADRLSVSVDVESIFTSLVNEREHLPQFNKGEKSRFMREMDLASSNLIVKTFSQYFEELFLRPLSTPPSRPT